MPPRGVRWLALPIVALACAAPKPATRLTAASPEARAAAPDRDGRDLLLQRGEEPRTAAAPPGVARAPFEPTDFDAVFDRAVRRLVEGGYAIAECDVRRGAVTTAQRELEVPCGTSVCLGRQSLSVVLGHRAAKVSVTRELFDAALRGWIPAPVQDAERDAERVARDIAAARALAGERGRVDPCPDLPPPARPAPPAEPEPDPFADAPVPAYGDRAAQRKAPAEPTRL